MNLVCLVLVACTVLSRSPGKTRVSCEVVESACAAVDAPEEDALRSSCVASPYCLEASPRIFVQRRMVEAPSPGETKL